MEIRQSSAKYTDDRLIDSHERLLTVKSGIAASSARCKTDAVAIVRPISIISHVARLDAAGDVHVKAARAIAEARSVRVGIVDRVLRADDYSHTVSDRNTRLFKYESVDF
jgi:hypothetical protein